MYTLLSSVIIKKYKHLKTSINTATSYRYWKSIKVKLLKQLCQNYFLQLKHDSRIYNYVAHSKGQRYTSVLGMVENNGL